MPDRKYVSWVHGSSMQVEYLNRLTGVRHCGPFVRIEGAAGQNTWVHFPIPTPAVMDNKKMRAGAALVSFRTRSHATVHEVIVYDGEQQVAVHSNLGLQGDHLEARFEVPDHPNVNQGINITLGVMFSPGAPDVRVMQIEVVGAGMEFLAPPARARAAKG
ncbi:MAG: hypothetical protein FJ316_12200 [SAR202 cluster bacterium]|nr:hypothetical protein [SAR202 cluster bacterium]